VRKLITPFFFGFAVLFLSGRIAAQCPITNACIPGNASNPQANLFGCGILQVKIGDTFNNVTGGTSEGYKDYCNLGNIQVSLGTPTAVYIKTGNNISENLKVYLDVNNDQAFTESEVVFSSTNAKVHTGSFIVPSGVTGQPVKLRVTSDAVVSAVLPGACSTPEYSQVEDYAVVLGANSNPPVSRFSVSDTLTCTGIVTFTDQSLNNPTSWFWNFGDGQMSTEVEPSHIFQSTMNGYTINLIALTDLNCLDSMSISIGYQYNELYYIPNSFTPDGDQNNQVFLPIFYSGYDPLNFEMQIYNRWGEVLFETRNVLFGWDGSVGEEGLDAQEGVYTYRILFKNPDLDERVVVTGTVNLIR
jgi:gliding motility-associated-like protein